MNTYQHGLNRRSINEVFETILKSSPTLLGLIARGANAINTKHEWINDIQDAKQFALASNYTAGGTMAFINATNLLDGSVFRFETSAGKSVGATYKAVSKSGNTVTVAVVGGTDANIASTSSLILVSEPAVEGALFATDASHIPATNWNFTQIFKKVARVTGTQQATSTHGIPNALAYQEQYQLGLIMRELNRQLISGFRAEGSTENARMMGGLAEYVYSVDGANAALDLAMFNNALQEAYTRGAINPNVIVAHPQQAAKFAAMKINTTTMRQDNTGGSYVAQVEGNLGGVHNIVYDLNQAKDRIDIVDVSMVELNYLREFVSEDLAKTSDSFERAIIGELTASIRNGQNCHIAIRNLAV